MLAAPNLAVEGLRLVFRCRPFFCSCQHNISFPSLRWASEGNHWNAITAVHGPEGQIIDVTNTFMSDKDRSSTSIYRQRLPTKSGSTNSSFHREPPSTTVPPPHHSDQPSERVESITGLSRYIWLTCSNHITSHYYVEKLVIITTRCTFPRAFGFMMKSEVSKVAFVLFNLWKRYDPSISVKIR
jgi:hypothetical protein